MNSGTMIQCSHFRAVRRVGRRDRMRGRFVTRQVWSGCAACQGCAYAQHHDTRPEAGSRTNALFPVFHGKTGMHSPYTGDAQSVHH